MTAPPNGAPPQPEPQPYPGPQPHPIAWQFQTISTPGGPLVVVVVQHFAGSTVLFFTPQDAVNFGRGITQQARQPVSGLIVPQGPLPDLRGAS